MIDDKRIAIGGAIKALGGDKFGGYLVRFYNPDERDLHGEWFSKNTDFHLEDYPVVGAPVLFHHGLDPTIGVKTIGRITAAKKDDYGLWVEGIYDERKEYIDHIKRMVDNGILDFSSGALPQSVSGTSISRLFIIFSRYRANNSGFVAISLGERVTACVVVIR